MLIRKWKSHSTWYRMIANFKYGVVYTNIIQISLKNPWLFPKYEDNFAGIDGFRLYGWLFFYFGRAYYGFLYPAEKETTGGFLDKNGTRWFIAGKNKRKDEIDTFLTDVRNIKNLIKMGYRIVWTRTYLENGQYNISAVIQK